MEPTSSSPEQHDVPGNDNHSFAPPEDRKHSRLGIASFILSVITLVGYILLGAMGNTMIEPFITPDGTVLEPTQETLEAMTTLAAIFMIIIFINLVGLILGLAGAFTKQRKRVFGVVGSIINGVIMLTIGSLFFMVLTG
ncbi:MULTISPECIES: hypothetical protein [Paenibacillus]|uniref:DUF4064 domain-containing protein n=1 Tax=Paenibacillus campinasensis TaxID=66347 RepID=A0A268EJD8_9BACL|nr:MULTISPECIES: hypothetical protein [Paenibacillus]MUG66178.1 hypothetical protein [Paenibacillus campinasensis]PAD73248.1 hypothetical protein CHH67_20380 [Paenibacillus campinasensis]PAK49423.1 hypothetical protein CHH75_20895 [Paenibacillus sp. 7541]